ncbi:MAG: 7-cyano-7-deazaguanine synthase QueC [Promethearchaeota archaeon]
MTDKSKAIVMVSGGLDSITTLHYALKKHSKSNIFVILFDYGQRHRKELDIAHDYLKFLGLDNKHIFNVKIRIPFSTSSLTSTELDIPNEPVEQIGQGDIPSTFVPGRNIIFLGIAAGKLYEVTKGDKATPIIYYGANSLDYSGYPDCRPNFVKQMEKAISEGLDLPIRIQAPYLTNTKAEIVKEGIKLGVHYDKTWSCYKGNNKPCLQCDSCKLRVKAFYEAGLIDPLFKPEEWNQILQKVGLRRLNIYQTKRRK